MIEMKDIDFLNKQVMEMRQELRKIAQWQLVMRKENREAERKAAFNQNPTEDTLLNDPEECLRSTLKEIKKMKDEIKSNRHAYILERSRYIEERYIYYPDIKEYVITGSIFENGHIMSKINQKLKTKKRGRKSIKRWDKNGQRYDAIYPVDESEIEMIEEVITFEIARYFKDQFKTIRRMSETQKVGEYNMPKEVEEFSLNFA